MEAQDRIQTSILHDHVKFPLPILFAYAGDDRVAKASLNETVGETLVSDDKTVIRREGEQHEILNEVNRKELFDTLAEWVLKRA
jgi:alpha-beta hydrolase superfamily lysophospholipase